MGYPEAQYTIDEVNSHVSDVGNEIKTGVINGVSAKLPSSGGAQTFTSNGTFTVPAGVTKILVTACAGGGGGNNYGSVSYSAGEGGEWIFKQPFQVNSGENIAITVGMGGLSSSSKSNVNPGGNTVIGSLITLLGGGVTGNMSGGMAGSSSAKNAENAIGTDGFLSGGMAGKTYSYSGTTYYFPGGGGSLGRGANGNGDKRTLMPGGGGNAQGSSKGGNGGNGIVIIEW